MTWERISGHCTGFYWFLQNLKKAPSPNSRDGALPAVPLQFMRISAYTPFSCNGKTRRNLSASLPFSSGTPGRVRNFCTCGFPPASRSLSGHPSLILPFTVIFCPASLPEDNFLTFLILTHTQTIVKHFLQYSYVFIPGILLPLFSKSQYLSGQYIKRST